jgi:hypothetical protein
MRRFCGGWISEWTKLFSDGAEAYTMERGRIAYPGPEHLRAAHAVNVQVESTPFRSALQQRFRHVRRRVVDHLVCTELSYEVCVAARTDSYDVTVIHLLRHCCVLAFFFPFAASQHSTAWINWDTHTLHTPHAGPPAGTRDHNLPLRTTRCGRRQPVQARERRKCH